MCVSTWDLDAINHKEYKGTVKKDMGLLVSRLGTSSVEMCRTTECGRCTDQKSPSPSSGQTTAIHVGNTYPFFSFLSPRQEWTVPDGVL